MKIKNIKKIQEFAPTYDFEVEDTHNYLIKCGDSFIVSHNSSVISGGTSGLEPIREAKVSKGSGAGKSIVLAPEYTKYEKYYTLAFDIRHNEPLINVYAGVNKFTCMSISLNTYTNVKHYKDGAPSLSEVVSDIKVAHKRGCKTMYYSNTDDGSHTESEDCAGGGCKL